MIEGKSFGETDLPPMVSIIMPVLNGERFIPDAIQSVLAQMYPHWELVVIDDGSTDDTAEIVAAFHDPRIRYAYQENQGLASARNAGIAMAQGQFFAFLDADDKLTPEFLNVTVAALAAQANLAAVYTLARLIDRQNNELPTVFGRVVPVKRLRRELLKGGLFPPVTALTNASVVRRVGGFDSGLDGMGLEDWDLWLRISTHYGMQGIPKPLSYYRINPGSMSTNALSMHQCRMSILCKHFGAPTGDSSTWSDEKRRAYGYGYRGSAFGYFAQREPAKGWAYLEQAVSIYAPLLTELDTFYPLACGNQARLHPAQADSVEVMRNGAAMFQWLEDIFANTERGAASLRTQAFGVAYVALGMYSQAVGRGNLALKYYGAAIRVRPRLLFAHRLLRRCLKLLLNELIARVRSNNLQPSGRKWPKIG